MALIVRPSSSSSSSSSSYMRLLNPFNTGIGHIIRSFQSLEDSYNRLQELYEETVTNGHDHSSNTLQQLRSEIYSTVYFSIGVANFIDSSFKSILPRHTLDYAYDRIPFSDIQISKSEILKLSKFQKKIDLARNEVVDLTIKLYYLRRRINKSYEDMVRNRFYNITGEMPDDVTMNEILSIRTSTTIDVGAATTTSKTTNLVVVHDDDQEMMLMKKVMKERHGIMMKIEKGMEDLEGILFGIYVMVQCQIRILNVADEKFDRDGKPDKENVIVHRSVETLVEEEEKKACLLDQNHRKLNIIKIIFIALFFFLSVTAGWKLAG